MMTLVMMHVTSETPSKSSCLAEVYAEHYWMTLFCFAIKFDFFFFFFFGKTTCVVKIFFADLRLTKIFALLPQMKIMSRLVLVITVTMLLD